MKNCNILKKILCDYPTISFFPKPHPDEAAFIMPFGRRKYLEIVNESAKVQMIIKNDWNTPKWY